MAVAGESGVMGGDARYLLIIACSQRKRSDPGLLPAIERYDGVNFRVLRKAKREGYWLENVDVLILSAQYGWLQPHTPIQEYNLQMTKQRALALQSEVSAGLDACLQQIHYCEVFVNLGKIYLITLNEAREISSSSVKFAYARGGIGEKMAQMKQWLEKIYQSHKMQA